MPASRACVERALQGLVLREVLAADVDVDLLRLDRVRRDQAALDQPVRDLEHDLAVLERARLGLVRVDGDVDRLRDLVGRRDEARLAAGREERAAAAAQVRLDHLLDHGLRILGARLLELRVAADRAVRLEAAERLALEAREDERRPFGDADGRLTHWELRDDRRHVLRRHRLPIDVVDGDDRRRRAAAEALDRAQRDLAVLASSRRALMPSASSNASSTACALTSPQQTFVQTSIVCRPTGSSWNQS